MSTLILDNIERLSVAEHIQLAEDIWDSIARTPQVLELPQSQRAELDARLEAHHRDESAAASWAEVKARIGSA